MSARFPQDALAALQGGDPLTAELLCRRRLGIYPRDAAARALLPVALLHQQRHEAALPLLETLAAEKPDDASHALNLGLALIALGRVDEAIPRLERATRRWPKDARMRATLGHARLQRGYAAAAAADLEAALSLEPRDAHAASLLARALVEAGGRSQQASELADALLRAGPREPATLIELALALVGLQRDADAERCLDEARRIDPSSHHAAMQLAYLYERQNRLDSATLQLESVGPATRGDPLWQLVRGRLQRRCRAFDESRATLEALLRRQPTGPVAAEAATELGKALHELAQHDAAYEAFEHANQLMLEIESGGRDGRPAADDQGSWLLRTYGREEVAAWSPPVASAERAPIFVVGFPRSGTTLLENMLDAHPALQALEEKPAVDAMLAVLEQHGGVDAGLARMDEVLAAECRDAYWCEAARHVELRDDARLVDRYPLNMARLAVASRVFPGAKFVLAVRHPCDVVLSCFMQNFRIADGTEGFHTLANGARIYDRLMRKWLAEVEAFTPPLHVLRYEDFVTDVRGHAERLAAFLGVAWDDGLLDPAGHARSRGRIHTPSYAQVVQPVYTTAVARWRHYERHFGAALGVLAPWARHWGYDAP
ncbi:MAG: sulfotransferase family protein [Lysobacterales bacterium]|nr:MAG: sulfotransferase family protein [Xanthomonadales bacterium]